MYIHRPFLDTINSQFTRCSIQHITRSLEQFRLCRHASPPQQPHVTAGFVHYPTVCTLFFPFVRQQAAMLFGHTYPCSRRRELQFPVELTQHCCSLKEISQGGMTITLIKQSREFFSRYTNGYRSQHKGCRTHFLIKGPGYPWPLEPLCAMPQERL